LIITHIGGPTTLIEFDGWRLLTDPTFDPAGGHYDFGWGTSSSKVVGPAMAAPELPPIDVVLLTHDHHGDNLDTAGRALLPSVGTVITTVNGARRLQHASGRGLAAGDTTMLTAPDKPAIEVTATPARHGPPLSRRVVGDVVGFALRRQESDRVLLWITGDTVLHRPLRRMAATLSVDVALVHVGGVQFPVTGPVRYTMTGRKAVELIGIARPRVAFPVHYEGWTHFKARRDSVERALAATSEDVRRRVSWLPIGSPHHVA
jgi:L-ascorbate metabolism protein UlaG (beta-lactamase superfamily)